MILRAMGDATTTDTAIEQVPLARRMLAGLIDAAVVSLPAIRQMRRAMRAAGAGGTAAKAPGWTQALSAVFEIVGEQVGTPGERIMGVRTVDKRTGRRVVLWRSLVLATVRIGARLLGRRLKPRPAVSSQAEHRQRADEIQAIKERYADDEDARNAALMRYYSEHRVNVRANVWPVFAAGMVPALLNLWIRRRLAPTVVVARASGK